MMDAEILARYKIWADDLLYCCISGLSDAERQKERAMLFGNILSLLHHVYAMDRVWKSHLVGGRHNYETRNPEVDITYKELFRKQTEMNSWFEAYYTQLPKAKITEEVEFVFIGGGKGCMTRAEIMQHIVNHATYHRGHIEGVLYQLSIEPPTTDLPVFLKSKLAKEHRYSG